MISVKGLRKSYGHSVVVDDVDLEIPAGGVTSIIGANGAGKSTLLGIVSRLLDPDAGVVTVDGLDVTTTRGDEIARRLAILRQDNHLAVRLTVRDLVRFGRYPWSKGRPTAADAELVERAIGWGRAGRSGRPLPRRDVRWSAPAGVRRDGAVPGHRLPAARRAAEQPRHAPRRVDGARGCARPADELGRTVVLVLHDINFASCWSDRIIAMRDGAVVHQGIREEIMRADVLRDVYGMDIQVEEIGGRRIGVYFT